MFGVLFSYFLPMFACMCSCDACRRPAVRGSCRSSLRRVRTAGARPRRPS
uniref:Uncharacterized protein n=1 Tax=Setaria viridis TaxID=4556 RepID=A0A4U6VYY7_SETVI|nr:hypothetical protein SEVIR_2G360850v2 [Setaria viridis]